MAKGKYKKGTPRKAKKVAEPALKLAAPDTNSEVETTIFRSGNSDAVRIPKAFGLLGKKVKLRREGSRVIMEPAEKRKWPPGFFESIRVGDDFELPPRPGPEANRDRDERIERAWNEPLDD